jgi:Tol biopolymer transport system component
MPILSPDGNWLAAVRTAPSSEILISRANGDDTHLIWGVDGQEIYNLTWLPDSHNIAFIASQITPEYVSDLILINIDGSNQVRLNRPGQYIVTAVWLPERNRFLVTERVYQEGQYSRNRLALIYPDGSSTESMPELPVPMNVPELSSDGAFVIFVGANPDEAYYWHILDMTTFTVTRIESPRLNVGSIDIYPGE